MTAEQKPGTHHDARRRAPERATGPTGPAAGSRTVDDGPVADAAHAAATLATGNVAALDAGDLAVLQRHVGNHTLQRAAEARSPVLDVVGSGGGSPLAPGVREDMEARLGADFSDVRVHTGGTAASSAAAVGAHAYTVGRDVVFGAGKFDTTSTAGKTMLAHELTHVVQQRSGPVSGTPTGDGVSVSDPGDRFEREAVANAETVMRAPLPTAVSRAPEVQGHASPPVAAEDSAVLYDDRSGPARDPVPGDGRPVQRAVERARLNVVGEEHDESEKAPRRGFERKMAAQLDLAYWTEGDFQVDLGAGSTFGDSLAHLVLQSAAFAAADLESLARFLALTRALYSDDGEPEKVESRRVQLSTRLEELKSEAIQLGIAADRLESTGESEDLVDAASGISVYLRNAVPDYLDDIADLAHVAADARRGELLALVGRLEGSLGAWRSRFASILRSHGYDLAMFATGDGVLSAEALVEQNIVHERSLHMYLAAEHAATAGRVGMWKVGDEHVSDMRGQPGMPFALTDRKEFNDAYSAWLATSQRAGGAGTGGDTS